MEILRSDGARESGQKWLIRLCGIDCTESDDMVVLCLRTIQLLLHLRSTCRTLVSQCATSASAICLDELIDHLAQQALDRHGMEV